MFPRNPHWRYHGHRAYHASFRANANANFHGASPNPLLAPPNPLLPPPNPLQNPPNTPNALNITNTINIITCPHCGEPVSILASEINCGIFRHAVFRSNGEPVPPHSAKAQLDQWNAEGLLYGCAKPFRYDGRTVSICSYDI